MGADTALVGCLPMLVLGASLSLHHPFFMAIPSATSPKSGSTKADAATAAAVASHSRTTRWLLGLICFFSGASIMVIEIAANRLLAPSFGNSIYTWTALIGVVLVALSVGGYLGGYLSDKFSRLDLLGALLAGAAILTMFIPALSSVLSPHFPKGAHCWPGVYLSLPVCHSWDSAGGGVACQCPVLQHGCQG